MKACLVTSFENPRAFMPGSTSKTTGISRLKLADREGQSVI